ncbi:MAG TPA: sigma-70 family RNA polymerase sigma factor [Acidimicrobiia bacterium]|nr:sigma-70 family RNA polymerase sigma factor [Acidimicrobiia bacterium]
MDSQIDDGAPAETSDIDPGERALVAALRAGDEGAFAQLIDRYYTTMIRVARMHVATREAAEDVVQETFLGVIKGIDRFEERSSLRTWMFRILVNRAKTRGEREARTRPFSSVAGELDADERSVDPERFLASGRWSGFWAAPPSTQHCPEARVLASEAGARVAAAIDALPPAQRTVITMRDVQGCTSEEVCAALDISEANQRVLLHRARSKTRAFLEQYLDERTGVH